MREDKQKLIQANRFHARVDVETSPRGVSEEEMMEVSRRLATKLVPHIAKKIRPEMRTGIVPIDNPSLTYAAEIYIFTFVEVMQLSNLAEAEEK